MSQPEPTSRRERRTTLERFRAFRLALVLAALVGGGAPAVLALAAPTEGTVQVAGTGGSGARLRDQPGLDSGILLVVPEGALVLVLGTAQVVDGREWSPVRYNGTQGWMASSFLQDEVAEAMPGTTPTTPASPAGSGVANGEIAVGGQAVVAGTGGASLRIRADASLSAPILGHAPFGATVDVIAGPRGEWYGVRHDGIEGWAYARYLAPVAGNAPVESTAPVAAPSTTRAPAGTTATATRATATTVPATTVPATAAPATGSGTGAALAASAVRYLGVPYVWGGASPSGWDCSGFVYYVYRAVTGRTLPRTTQAQWGVGTPVARNALQPGDLVFFQNTYEPGITHVGFSLGGDRFVHASAPGVGTIISNLTESYYAAHYAGARRV